MPAKRGQLTSKDRQFIRDHFETMTVEDIAATLNRRPITITTYLRKYYNVNVDSILPQEKNKIKVKSDFQNRPEYLALKDELTEEELKFFEHRYSLYMEQFKVDDILTTEETQLFLLIKFELLMRRNLRSQKESVTQIAKLQQILDTTLARCREKDEELDNETKNFISNLAQQISMLDAAGKSHTIEYIKLEEKHAAIMKDLKGTRDQRVQRLENSKQNWVGLIKYLEQEDVRAIEGRQAELMKLAMEKEKDRVSQPFTYVDKTVDLPLLNSETIG